MRSRDWKLIEFYDLDKTELYNLEDDLSEQIDISLQHPEKVKELKKELTEFQKSTNSKLPVPNPIPVK